MSLQVTSRAAFRRAEPDERRQSLIEAAARVLACEGAGGASVRAIAVEAGVSPGLVGHYFGGIEALHAAAYGWITAQVDSVQEKAVAAAGSDPRARLDAFVTASLAPPIADPQLLASWIAIWSLVRTRAEIASQHDEQYAAFRARLEQLLSACGLADQALRPAAIAITALVDGLWLELCLSPQAFAPGEAAEIARQALDRLISTGR